MLKTHLTNGLLSFEWVLTQAKFPLETVLKDQHIMVQQKLKELQGEAIEMFQKQNHLFDQIVNKNSNNSGSNKEFEGGNIDKVV
jgi:hypothetical protein